MSWTYLYLGLTVLCETFGTTCIQASQQFTRPAPALGVAIGYGLAFWFMSLALRTLPLAVVYATWSGLGILLISASGYFLYGQRIDLPTALGMAMIAGGMALMHFCAAARAG